MSLYFWVITITIFGAEPQVIEIPSDQETCLQTHKQAWRMRNETVLILCEQRIQGGTK